jgi:hypothetical protein
MYYLRSRPAADAVQFTVDKQHLPKGQSNGVSPPQEQNTQLPIENNDEEEACTMCSA